MQKMQTKYSIIRQLASTYAKIALVTILALEFIDLIFDSRDILYGDDKIIDGITIAFPIIGILLSSKILLESTRSFWLPYLPLFALNLLLLFEETSFGQEIFGFPSLKIGDVYFNAFHDIFSLLYQYLGTYILILGLIVIYIFIKKYRQLVEPNLVKYPPYWFVLLALSLLGLSLIFDLNIIYHPPAEEYLEMLGTLAVLFSEIAVLRIFDYKKRSILSSCSRRSSFK